MTDEQRRREEEKRDFYKNGTWAFYGIVVGLITGAWGNYWASFAYDYFVNQKSNLALSFTVASIVLAIMVLLFAIPFIWCFWKYKPWRL
jgi:membrane protein YdbS with pleckstrin-like domain